MTPHFGAGLLVKAYVEEPGSPIADALLSACDVPVAFAALHALDIRNALQLKRFRREMTDDEVAGVLLALQDDIAGPRLRIRDRIQ
ncbi:MAG: hypothetical protein J0L84_08210 [Verrucomicrobia bacterium]|nr:hypothetical protein [Verrucomicrobiota bacterium]